MTPQMISTSRHLALALLVAIWMQACAHLPSHPSTTSDNTLDSQAKTRLREKVQTQLHLIANWKNISCEIHTITIDITDNIVYLGDEKGSIFREHFDSPYPMQSYIVTELGPIRKINIDKTHNTMLIAGVHGVKAINSDLTSQWVDKINEVSDAIQISGERAVIVVKHSPFQDSDTAQQAIDSQSHLPCVFIIDTSTGTVLNAIELPYGHILDAAVSPDLRYLALRTGLEVLIFDLETQQTINRIGSYVNAITFTSDNYLVVLSSSGRITIMETESGDVLHEVEMDTRYNTAQMLPCSDGSSKIVILTNTKVTNTKDDWAFKYHIYQLDTRSYMLTHVISNAGFGSAVCVYGELLGIGSMNFTNSGNNLEFTSSLSIYKLGQAEGRVSTNVDQYKRD